MLSCMYPPGNRPKPKLPSILFSGASPKHTMNHGNAAMVHITMLGNPWTLGIFTQVATPGYIIGSMGLIVALPVPLFQVVAPVQGMYVRMLPAVLEPFARTSMANHCAFAKRASSETAMSACSPRRRPTTPASPQRTNLRVGGQMRLTNALRRGMSGPILQMKVLCLPILEGSRPLHPRPASTMEYAPPVGDATRRKVAYLLRARKYARTRGLIEASVTQWGAANL
mmetsp:Transcript_7587/g.11107  ORF Transcript_7587/g.11107 Transcript_7587/m.11107 type:complete len:226 (-) Transcript_7587:1324-2001(-)